MDWYYVGVYIITIKIKYKYIYIFYTKIDN